MTMSAPRRRQPSAAAAQPCGSGLCMRSQASMPNLAGSRPNDLSCSFNAASFCSACVSAAMIGIQPSPSRAARRTAASDEPPNQIGIGRCTGAGTMLTSLRLWKRPLKRTRLSVHSRRSTLTCSAWRPRRLLASRAWRAAARPPPPPRPSFPDWSPPRAAAAPQAPATQEIDLRRLLGDDPGLALRRDQNAAREPDGLGGRRQKAERHEGLVEGRLFVVERNPAVARRGAEDVIGHLDIGVAEVFRRLRPIADLRGIAADIERREEGVELHVGPPTGSGRGLGRPPSAPFLVRPIPAAPPPNVPPLPPHTLPL